jgi:signal transduction histidine kinase
MAAGVAHEFRNSLATVTGYLQLLEKNVSTEQQSYTSPIHKELGVLQKVVKDFLSFAGPVQMRVSRMNLHDLLHECVEELKVSAAGKNVEITMNGSFPEMEGDETMLRQIFTNLLRNAAESMDGTGRNGKVDVAGGISANGRFVTVDVLDNGKGIPPGELSKIFHPFFSTKQDGVGLGLAIVQKLIVQHNGTVSVESSSEGSIFHVQLPVG